MAGALAAVMITTVVLPPAAFGEAPVITESHQATSGAPSVRTYASPAVVVDPDDPTNVFAAGVEYRNRQCVFLRSRDAGRTWRQWARSPSPTGYPFCTHNLGVVPVGFLAMGRDKTLYWAHVGTSVEDTPNLSIFLSRSTDLGETWTSTVVRDAKGKQGADAERNVLTDLAVDTRSGSADIVYVTWMAAPVRATPPRAPRAIVAVSLDGGRTFVEPVDVAESFFARPGNLARDLPPERAHPASFGSMQPNLAVTATGGVHVVWMEFALGDPFHSPVRWRRMYVSSSSDRGRTFNHALVRTMTTDGVGLLNPMLEWSAKGGPEGSLHLVYESRLEPAQGDRDVQYQRSVDGGQTWSAVKVLNDDDPNQLFGQFLPNVQIAPNGRIDVAWWDMRDGAANYASDVYFSYSEDAGESWSTNLRVTDRSIDRTIGVWSNNSDTRQPPGLGSADELAVAVWDDTRNGDPVTESQDLRAAAVQFEVLEKAGTAQRTMAYVLAGLAGAGAVGLLLVAGILIAGSGRARPIPVEREVSGSHLRP